MFSLRGDAHKIYLQLKQKGIEQAHFLTEIKEIKCFYNSIDTETLTFIYYRMIKERNASGIIPLFVSSIPWLLFLFSTQLQKFLFKDGSVLWAIFGAVYLLILVVCVLLHYREKAWAALHIAVIEGILKESNVEKIE
ncbi:hypothetical protein MXL46_05905 [Heyndrickxia sporothermodurans]|uniref:Uncharacterized protein n=1 Tax=Heyndrickxia sporothermodurans TaxID=46224 RepID=A0A150L9P8_9BACI|nr:hypothetical protein [Heyndrickxia sporothermodurans]KYD09073.1 hypothetical protein B4102_2600 [Heyndrickxia sporothermodurans]MEB6548641.1 hypothetical protein [Heyndrickxia sporothermodurans]